MRVDSTAQVLLLLCERLNRLSGGDRTSASARTATPQATPRARRNALTDLAALPDDQARGAVVRAMLIDRWGEAIESDPGFQRIVGEVIRILSDDERALGELDAALTLLRRGPT